MEKTFRGYTPNQTFLFPRSLDEYVAEGDLCLFVRELTMEQLDLSGIYENYAEAQGKPPFNPTMMTALLLYAYSQGIYASRRIERACAQRVDFMVVTAHETPDHRTIAKFRKRHEEALSGLFEQVLKLCAAAGLVKLGHVAIDGTKVRANASKHKAMSYGRMDRETQRLKASVEEWFAKAEQADQDDDAAGGTGEELPDWVKNRQERMARIEQAKRALEKQAREQSADQKDNDRDGDGGPQLPPKSQSRKKKGEEHLPHEKDQYNFTDPESSIMKTRGTFEQCYNAQIAVDGKSQVIVAQTVTNAPNDTKQLIGVTELVEKGLSASPDELSADAGYFTEENIAFLESRKIHGYVAPGREAKRTKSHLPTDSLRARMARKISKAGRRSRYRLRKQIVEPVFGQIKQARGFRQFLCRSLQRVRSEWSLVCTVSNIMKLAAARSG